MKKWLQRRVQHWQYNPYGSRRHNFAFAWLTGRGIFQSILEACKRPYKFTKELK